MSWIFALLGLATAIAGGGAMVMGWPLVPLERGWTLVIAGAALASGGLVCLALAALMGETRRTRRMIERALAEVAWARPIERASATTLPLEPEATPSRPAERPFTPSVATSFGLDKVEPVMPMMPMMPAAAPLGSVDPAPEAKPATARPEPAREGCAPELGLAIGDRAARAARRAGRLARRGPRMARARAGEASRGVAPGAQLQCRRDELRRLHRRHDRGTHAQRCAAVRLDGRGAQLSRGIGVLVRPAPFCGASPIPFSPDSSAIHGAATSAPDTRLFRLSADLIMWRSRRTATPLRQLAQRARISGRPSAFSQLEE